jgi:hypothetical protein
MPGIDNLRANTDKLSYNSVLGTDKIVKTYTGSFVFTTDTITRSYTLAGSPNNQKVYRFAHGFTRPGFVDLQWSVDGISYWQGGGTPDTSTNFAIGYSDSTYIYIMPNQAYFPGDRIYYKILFSWLDDFDTTDPVIAALETRPADYTQTFNSRVLAPTIIDSDVLSLSTASVFLDDVVQTVALPTGIAYAPFMKVYIEAFPGEVWPLNYGGTGNVYLVDDSQVEGQAFTSPTQFIVDLSMKASNGTRRVWYNLYGRTTTTFKVAVYSTGVI